MTYTTYQERFQVSALAELLFEFELSQHPWERRFLTTLLVPVVLNLPAGVTLLVSSALVGGACGNDDAKPAFIPGST